MTRHVSRRLLVECLEDRTTPANINVTTTLDVIDPADGKRSLREAVNRANALAGADVIVLPTGQFKIALDGANENLNATGDFDVSGAVTIRGAGAGLTVINGQRKDRLFDVIGSITARFVDVTLRGGGGLNNGGAVQALDADIQLLRCVVTDNQSFKGGGINAENGDVAVTDSTISRNLARDFGGGVNTTAGTLTMTGSSIRRNAAGAGGGLCVTSATLTSCTISGNSSDNGGGIFAIDSVSLNGCTVSGNSSYSSGGGIRAFDSVTLTDSTVSGNRAATEGGGISTDRSGIIIGEAILTRSTVSGNSAGSNGGGIDSEFATLTASTVSGNFAAEFGGGINATSTTVTRSTVSGNSSSSSGGGIHAGSATLTNSTISGNTCAGFGGGLIAHTATMQNCTIADNVAGTGGGLFKSAGGNFSIRNTIVAQNMVYFGETSPDVSGDFLSLGSNLIGDGAGATGFTDGVGGDIVGTFTSPIDPKLGVLKQNGGKTKTHALLAGSLAIDKGENAGAPATDQRGAGFPRIKDGDGNGTKIVDIGAFEK